jgi:hypothetical protein
VVAERAKHDLSPRRLLQIASEGADVLVQLPHRLDMITQRLASGEMEAKVDIPSLGPLMQALQKVANRIFSGLVLGGLIVASANLMPYRRTLGTAGFIIAGVLGMYMVLVILFTDRRDKT